MSIRLAATPFMLSRSVQTKFLYSFDSASFRTSSLTLCAWLLCASSVASSVWTRMESRRPTMAMGARLFLRASKIILRAASTWMKSPTAQLREAAERRRVLGAFCQIVRELLANSEVMRTTPRHGGFIECAVREGRLMVELLLLILADVSTPPFDCFMRRLSEPANLGDKLRDAGRDFRRGEMALRPTLAFRARLVYEILRRTFSLGILYAGHGRLLRWGIQSLFTELIWFRFSKAHSH